MLAEWLARPHLPFPNLLAPPTCLCTVTDVTVVDGALHSYRWKDGGGGGDEKGISSILLRWPRKLCNHSTAQTLSFSSLHIKHLASVLKHNSNRFVQKSCRHRSHGSINKQEIFFFLLLCIDNNLSF